MTQSDIIIPRNITKNIFKDEHFDFGYADFGTNQSSFVKQPSMYDANRTCWIECLVESIIWHRRRFRGVQISV